VGGPIVLIHTGTGEEIPFINHRYQSLCADRGYPAIKPGADSTKDILTYYSQLGCAVETVKDRWQWRTSIPIDRALEHVRRRSYSFTLFPPEEVHHWAIQKIEEELAGHYGTLKAVIEVQNQVSIVVVTRPGA